MADTRIPVSDETWRELNAKKQDPGETFDDVLERLLNDVTPEPNADTGHHNQPSDDQ